jgi:DNA-binding CsgD family transcriptional regulator
MTALSCSERPADSAHSCELAELRDRLRAAETALDHVNCAVIVLDAQARVRSLNRAAQAVLVEGDGLARHGDGLTAQFGADAEALRQLLAHASGADGIAPRRGALRLRRGLDRAPLVAVAIPAARHVLLFIADPSAQPSVASDLLREAFGLTRREIAVALATLRLGGLAAAAVEMKVALTTARSHLQHVFDKTGTRSQLALAQVLVVLGALPDAHASALSRYHGAAA